MAELTPMKIPKHVPFVISALLALSPAVSRGETPPAENKKQDEPIVLSPFTVQTQADTGFVAAQAVSGGRLSTELKDVAAAYSVLTRDFIDALQLKSFSDMQ